MKEASAIFRLARRRGPPPTASPAGRRAPERDRADRDPGHRAVGRLPTPRPAAGERAGRGTARRRVHVLPGARRPEARNGTAPLWQMLDAQFAASADEPIGARRSGAAEGSAAAAQGELRQPRRRSSARARAGAGQPGRGRSGTCCRRGTSRISDAARGISRSRPPRWARRVIAVDRSAEVLERAKALARRRGVSNIVWEQGELERVPLADGTVDVTLLSQALHHAADPAVALAECARITRAGGRVLVLDLRRHDETWVRDRLGDRWLGFDDAQLEKLLKAAGLTDVHVDVGARLTGDPFTVLVASGKVSAWHRNGTEEWMADRNDCGAHRGGGTAHSRARRRDGHDDSARPPDGRRLPRRALRESSARPQRQQRRPRADAARRHPRHPPSVPRRRLRSHRDEHVQQPGDLAGGLRPSGPQLRAERRGRPTRAAGVRRVHAQKRRISRDSSPARSARRTARCRCRRT